MIVDRDLIEGIVSGELTELRRAKEPRERVGHSYIVQSRVGGVTICRVRILEKVEDDPGWLLRFELEKQDRVRWLAASPTRGYVEGMAQNDGRPPAGAMRDEPEAISEYDQELLTRRAQATFRVFRTHNFEEALKGTEGEARLTVLREGAQRASVNGRDQLRLARKLLREGRDPSSPMRVLEKKIREQLAA